MTQRFKQQALMNHNFEKDAKKYMLGKNCKIALLN